MRILFTSTPLYGHFFPMLPLIDAAQAAGADVQLATGPDLAAEVERRHLSWWPVGPNVSERITATVMRRDDPPIADRLVAIKRDAMEIFGHPGIARARDLVPLARAWQPDVVVHEIADFAGWEAAAATDAVDVAHGYGPMMPNAVELTRFIFAEAAGALDSTDHSDRLAAATFVDPWPVSLRTTETVPFTRVLDVRPVPELPRVGESLPASVLELPYEETVYATLGTVFTAPDAFVPLLAAVADAPYNVIVTTGPMVDPASLGPPPRHVAVERFVPQALLLDRCSAVLSHAGSGTVLGALSRGLPQVCLPNGADQFVNAEQLRRRGAALTVLPDARTPPVIRTALDTVLAEDGYAAAARRLRDEINAMPSADQVLPLLLPAR